MNLNQRPFKHNMYYVPKMEKKIQRFKYKEKHPTRGNKEQD
jgi:hypothetical protein